jgi:transaldolase
MAKAGITDYKTFAQEAISSIPDKPISFEVFSDEMEEMKRQALLIRSWGENIYVKIPVTNTKGESTAALVHDLSWAGVKLNITAMMTFEQVLAMSNAIEGGSPAYLSVFAGRIADTGRDPLPAMIACVALLKTRPGQELIWASPRELLNVFQADEIGCHIITVTVDILRKLNQTGKDLDAFSLDTVKMFWEDARKSNFQL